MTSEQSLWPSSNSVHTVRPKCTAEAALLNAALITCHWKEGTWQKKKINYPYVVYNQISEEKMCLAKGKYSPDTLMPYGKKCCEQYISWVKDEERSEANEGR